jgi:hypothetical protein
MEALRERFREVGRAATEYPKTSSPRDDRLHYDSADAAVDEHEQDQRSREAAYLVGWVLDRIVDRMPFGSPGLYDWGPEAIEQLLNELAGDGVITLDPVITLGRESDLHPPNRISRPGRLRNALRTPCQIDLYAMIDGSLGDSALAVRRDQVTEPQLGSWWPGRKHFESVAVCLLTTGQVSMAHGKSRQQSAFESGGANLRPTRALLEVVERSGMTTASVARIDSTVPVRRALDCTIETSSRQAEDLNRPLASLRPHVPTEAEIRRQLAKLSADSARRDPPEAVARQKALDEAEADRQEWAKAAAKPPDIQLPKVEVPPEQFFLDEAERGREAADRQADELRAAQKMVQAEEDRRASEALAARADRTRAAQEYYRQRFAEAENIHAAKVEARRQADRAGARQAAEE